MTTNFITVNELLNLATEDKNSFLYKLLSSIDVVMRQKGLNGLVCGDIWVKNDLTKTLQDLSPNGDCGDWYCEMVWESLEERGFNLKDVALGNDGSIVVVIDAPKKAVKNFEEVLVAVLVAEEVQEEKVLVAKKK